MRFSTVFISSAVVLAGMSAALAIDSDFEVGARGFDEETELYARGGALSRMSGGRNRNRDRPPSYRSASRDPPPPYQGSRHHVPHLDSFRTETDYSRNRKSPSHTHATNPRHRGSRGSRGGRGGRGRRSYYEDDELIARGNTPSRPSHHGDKERKDGKPPKYKVAKHDPPPRYEGSPNHVPHLDSFQTETDYAHNHKSPSGTQHHHRRSFYDLD